MLNIERIERIGFEINLPCVENTHRVLYLFIIKKVWAKPTIHEKNNNR